jgi:hypothetical protein
VVREVSHARVVAEPSDLHRTAVVRVDIPSGEGDLIIQLVEVGLEDRSDRLVGRATDSAGACRLLDHWLAAIVDRPATGPPDPPR